MLQQVTYVLAGQQAKQAPAARVDAGELEINKDGQLLGCCKDVGFLRQIVVSDVGAMHSSQCPHGCSVESRIVNPRLVQGLTLDEFASCGITVVIEQARRDADAVQRAECVHFPSQQASRYPA